MFFSIEVFFLEALKSIDVKFIASESDAGRFFVLLPLFGINALKVIKFLEKSAGVERCVQDHCWKIDVVDREYLADNIKNPALKRILDLFHFLEQALQDSALDDRLTFLRFGGDEVVAVHFSLLTDTVNSTKSLFESSRIPRQVVVDHEMTELKVNAFACRFCCDANLCVCPEDFLCPFA